jgi:hypothetical protein
MRRRLLIFAKAPEAGQVKTRLIPVLGAAGAAGLHAALARRTLGVAVRSRVAAVELWCAPDSAHPFFQAMRRQYGVTLRSQPDGDLGARMGGAFLRTLPRTEAAVLIGTDCPGLRAGDLRIAFERLGAGVEAVLGPAADGGYWLIGLRHPRGALFRDIPWGTARVLSTTRAVLGRYGLSVHELPTRADVDRPEDLAGLDWRLDR